MTFWLLNGFVHRLPSAAFVDCSGIFEKAFSIAILIYPFVLKPYVARLKFYNAWLILDDVLGKTLKCFTD